MSMIDTHAIVLKSSDSGESSRRLTFFSGEEGRFSLTARGVKSKSGRAHASLEPYVIARVSANLKPEADLGTLGRAEVVERFARLREDLTRLAAAGVMCEAVDRGAHPRLANPRLYEYATAFLRTLDAEDADKVVFLLGHGLMRVAQALGIPPGVTACPACGGRPGDARLDLTVGGLVCVACAAGGGGPGIALRPGAAALMRACAVRPWSQIRVATDDGPETKALVQALTRWLSHQLEWEFRSARFLWSIGGSAACSETGEKSA